MNRKNFLRSTLGTLAALPVKSLSDGFSEEPGLIVTPPYLQSNDIIGICAPGGYVDLIDLEPAIQRLNEWGFSVKIGTRIGRRDFSMGGTDEERLSDFQELLNDRSVKAILCARGGYGSVRIIDRLDFTRFEKYPKWIIGFSDITVLHSHIHQKLKVASIHSKMCNSFPSDWAIAEPFQRISIESIRDCLTGKKMIYESAYHSQQLSGIGLGIISAKLF
jgi:muramoyltetrapeptide carboxypeptidase